MVLAVLLSGGPAAAGGVSDGLDTEVGDGVEVGSAVLAGSVEACGCASEEEVGCCTVLQAARITSSRNTEHTAWNFFIASAPSLLTLPD